jgi:eukaryotic-like serine/threonine-protein kinase
MGLAPGARIGRYEVLALIGEGGMGVVYRARDTRLDREVALKTLPDALTDDPERLARFEREAKLLATLNHPAIASVYGLEEADGARALVMELVDGRTLASILSDGPMPARKALPIARQVCEALEAAHARGIVHRDLKPGNVIIRPDGGAKVLDFGLAKLALSDSDLSEEVGAESSASRVATRSGVLLGTPPYMSPEQLEGGAADPRTDVWALGCLLYETLTGRSAFGRSSVWQTIAAVLEQPPDLDRLPNATPARVRLLVERCLRKDARRRFQHVGDARIEIEEAIAEGEAAGWATARMPAGAVGARAAGRPVAQVGLVAALALVSVGLGWALLSSNDPGPVGTEPLSFGVALPPGVSIGPGEVFTYTAVSPEGRRLAFAANGSASPLRVHELATGTTRILEGTEGASSPFWSPDGQAIAFFAEGQLKRVGLEGQPPRTISRASFEAGNTWSATGEILFAQPASGGITIHRVSAEGGEPTQVTQVDPETEIAHFWPHFLPDGRHFLYVGLERSTDPVPPRTLYLASLDGGGRRALLTSVSRAVYAPPGALLYVTEGVLVAHPFDAEALELTGEPRPVSDDLRFFYMTGQAEFSASLDPARPVIAYHGGGWQSQLVRYARSGEYLGALADPAAFDQVRVSPDGRQAVVDVLDPTNGGRDLWIYDLETGRTRRLTLHRADEQDPVWSSDGARILYRSDENGPPDLYVRDAAGGGAPERILASGSTLTPDDWARDGRVVFQVASRSTGLDQWILDVGDGGEPRPLLDTALQRVGRPLLARRALDRVRVE